MESFLHSVNAFIWGIPVLLLIIATGVVLSIRSRFVQIRLLPSAIEHFLLSLKGHNKNEDRVSGYRALCTALAATVGTGNIAGVAGAIAIGGPGVIFWMWICAILGMITKCAEVTLAVHFRHKTATGEYIGGPMYIIQNGMPTKYRHLAYYYSFFGIVAALGIGNAVQINTVIESITSVAAQMSVCFCLGHRLILGLCVSALIVMIFSRGVAGIGRVAENLVPFAAVIYILLTIIVLCKMYYRIPAVILEIVYGAFSPKAVTGGMLGSVFTTLRVGVSRGVFTNEAGMGTASIAHASSNATHPAEQGLMGIMEVFLDTIVLCTLTGLVILSSGISIPYGMDQGVLLALEAFAYVLGDWSKLVITALLCVFAFATILGWGLYGGRCFQYLFGEKSWDLFTYGQSAAVLLGATLNTTSIWCLAEIVNGLMAIPSLFGIFVLSGVFISIMNDYQKKRVQTSIVCTRFD